MIDCTFENGNRANLRHVTTDTLVVRDGKILMVKRRPDFLEGGKWALPGGYLSRDEELTDCAAREVMEETGWEVKIGPLLRIAASPRFRNDERQNVNFTYIAEAVRDTGTHDDESTDMRFFAPDELPPAGQIAFDHADVIGNYLSFVAGDADIPIIR